MSDSDEEYLECLPKDLRARIRKSNKLLKRGPCIDDLFRPRKKRRVSSNPPKCPENATDTLFPECEWLVMRIFPPTRRLKESRMYWHTGHPEWEWFHGNRVDTDNEGHEVVRCRNKYTSDKPGDGCLTFEETTLLLSGLKTTRMN